MIYVGITQNLIAARQYMLDQHNGMYPDIEMGPFKKREDADNYIVFMRGKFPDCTELELPEFALRRPEDEHKWWVFSFELVCGVQ